MKHFIVCDLDDCLLKTDLLYEQWLVLLKSKPLIFLLSPFWLLCGKAYFKSQLAEHIPHVPKLIPFRSDVLSYLKTKNDSNNYELILASASPFVWVNEISQRLELFNQVIGSDTKTNLKGTHKLKAIKNLIGDASFSYVGDAFADLDVWRASTEIVAVNPSKSLQALISTLNKPTTLLKDVESSTLQLLAKQIRPHQWIKNILVFLPALAGHKLWNHDTFFQGLGAFAGFSLAASFVYVLNDLLDLKADRNHHTKKNRPFASGDLKIKWGVLLLPCLLLGVTLISSYLPIEYSGWIATYLFLNLAYSLYLKQSVVVDILILSMMYTLRIFAGSAATSVPVSEWLLSFSTLFFFSLACVKRYTEIIRSKNKITLDGRGYRQVDYPMVQGLGVGSGLLSVLIVLLYLQSADVRALYKTPQNLWFATPVLLFWISRIWILTNRDEVHDDPVVFAVKDKISWICFAILGVVFGISI
ncbi:UbiA family prenyltransferase [Bdellovibrio sp. 22V]|uniref:UbiA family prenyltransferase n=1 Tax=Bdellovibrio sp. 22V TaxID=3044166 RepID=UPI002542D539|nr:UbiA family prenyltransferase [Bdellovibrio sp. 22V]WII71835.1 UbiA family prenyltransferase [Bdellovibrio sp. 22V]